MPRGVPGKSGSKCRPLGAWIARSLLTPLLMSDRVFDELMTCPLNPGRPVMPVAARAPVEDLAPLETG